MICTVGDGSYMFGTPLAAHYVAAEQKLPVLFVVFNTQTVKISLVFTDVRAPLVLALLIAAVLGAAVGGLLHAILTVRGRRRNR